MIASAISRRTGIKPVVANLARLRTLDPDELEIARRAEEGLVREYRADMQVAKEGRALDTPVVILSGWAARAQFLSDGRRQIVSILLPGDIAGVYPPGSVGETMPIVALTKVKTSEAVELGRLIRGTNLSTQRSSLVEAAYAAAAEEQYFIAGHVTRLGRQRASERMANLLMELDFRLTSRGLSMDGFISLPLSQETMADVLGLSGVHINRTLQQLRRSQMIELERGRLRIKDRTALEKISAFRRPWFSTTPRQNGVAVGFASAQAPASLRFAELSTR